LATIFLSKKNFFKNLQKISKVNPNILAVIKDNAYGHGIVLISKMLREFGIKKVCVRDNKEAEIVKDLFEEILIFNPHTGRSFFNFSYAINSIKQLKKNRHPHIHLKIDTGFGRNGISLDEVDLAIEIIKEKEFNLKGVFTHFCCADEIGNDTFIQYERFLKIKEKFRDFDAYFHIANSYALNILPNTLDYVRVGIAMYGGIEGYEPVMKLIGDVVCVKEIQKGDGCGYNKTFIAKEDCKISIVDIGYADGIYYFKNGCKLKDTRAVGKISMDYMCVIGEHKKVVIFDDIKEFAKNFDTITYDLLVKLSPRIKRVIEE